MPSFGLQRVLEGLCGECVWTVSGSHLEISPAPGSPSPARLPLGCGKTGIWPWSSCIGVRSISIEDGVLLPTKATGLFKGMREVEEVDLTGFDASQARNLSSMFDGCVSLKEVDLSALDFKALIHADRMFADCSSLERVTFPDTIPSLRTASHLLSDCVSLRSLSLDGLASPAFRDASHLLSGCVSLEEVSLQGWERAQMSDASFMFDDCRRLSQLDIADWDLSRADDLSFMFAGCAAMERLAVGRWDVSRCSNFSGMFSGCAKLRWLNLSRWTVSPAVTNMHYMFAACLNLFCVSMEGWAIGDAALLGHAFDECRSLQLLDLRGWDLAVASNLKVPKMTICVIDRYRAFRIP